MSNQTNNSGLYLYGIIPNKGQLKVEQLGMDKQKVFTIEYKDILAVVSNSDYKVYDLSSENLLIHDRVLKEIMGKSDVLPFNFSNVLKSKKNLTNFLNSTHIHILKMLRKVSGRVELGLKIFIKNEKFSEEIETGEIKKLKSQIENLDEKKSHFLKMDLGELVKKSIEEKQKECERKIFEPLKQHCASAKINNCSTIKMILNAAFLVDQNKKEIFDEKIDEICSKYEERFILKYSGPWPPYNFIEIPK